MSHDGFITYVCVAVAHVLTLSNCQVHLVIGGHTVCDVSQD